MEAKGEREPGGGGSREDRREHGVQRGASVPKPRPVLHFGCSSSKSKPTLVLHPLPSSAPTSLRVKK